MLTILAAKTAAPSFMQWCGYWGFKSHIAWTGLDRVSDDENSGLRDGFSNIQTLEDADKLKQEPADCHEHHARDQ